MADQEPNGGGNGADERQPQVSILAQYVKDLRSRIPSAPQVYSWQVQPQLDVQFNLNVDRRRRRRRTKSTLKFDISARSDNGVHFVVDLSYAGLFGTPQRAGRGAPALPADRSAAAAVPVRPPGHLRRGREHRLPAADARSDRFRGGLHGAGRGGPAAGRLGEGGEQAGATGNA